MQWTKEKKSPRYSDASVEKKTPNETDRFL